MSGELDRRRFLQWTFAGTLLGGCPVFADTFPDRLVIGGESLSVGHMLRDGHEFPEPTVRTRHDVVIVGGGLAGLTSAYLLRGEDVLLLEKEPQWGGNARLEERYDRSFAIGSAFLHEDDEAARLARELGLRPMPIEDWDGTVLAGRFIPNTWRDGLNELPYRRSVRAKFKALREDALSWKLEDEAGKLDQVALIEVLGPYGQEVLQWWHTYCPSNWGGRADRIAASVAIEELRWMAGDDESDGRATWPGGIGALSSHLAERLTPVMGERMIREATVIRVVPQNDRVEVTYVRDGVVTAVSAKTVIMATPQYISSRVLSEVPDDQLAAMRRLRYAPYAVVNLVFDRPVYDKTYDTWCPGARFCDVIVADWVERRHGAALDRHQVLTCYAPLLEEERRQLLTADGCRKLAQKVVVDFQGLLPQTRVEPIEVRIYRRGHAFHIAQPGLGPVQWRASTPIGRVSFANADSQNLVSSAAGAVNAARRAVREIEGFL